MCDSASEVGLGLIRDFSRATEMVAVAWPKLVAIGLDSASCRARRFGIGGSDANVILSSDPDRLLALWREKRGETESADLTGVLPVMLGTWTEAFNRQWYSRLTGLVVEEVGSVWTCARDSWRRATLDGFVEAKHAIWEAKHVSAFAKPDEVLTRYMPQLQHNMAVCGCGSAWKRDPGSGVIGVEKGPLISVI